MNSSANGSMVYFRVDYGGLIGRGHLSRCLALAEAFKEKKIEPVFVIRQRPSIKEEKLAFKVVWLPEVSDAPSTNPDTWIAGSEEKEAQEFLSLIPEGSLVVLDHYALGVKFQKAIRLGKHKLILFQDILGEYFADVLINYNVGSENLYQALSGSSGKLLTGPLYAPLKSDYFKEHKLRWLPETQVSAVGIYLGGIERKHLEKFAKVFSEMDYFTDKRVEWVVNTEDEKSFLKTITKNLNVNYHVRIPGLIEIYNKVQLFIGACGVSFLERACLGLWQLNFLVADNQKNIAKHIEDENLGILLGDIRMLGKEEMKQSILQALEAPVNLRTNQVNKVFNLVDGLGAARIVDYCVEGL